MKPTSTMCNKADRMKTTLAECNSCHCRFEALDANLPAKCPHETCNGTIVGMQPDVSDRVPQPKVTDIDVKIEQLTYEIELRVKELRQVMILKKQGAMTVYSYEPTMVHAHHALRKPGG